ncbi:MAG TPA: ribonuclease HII [Bryobacteraceae bacterium]|nr:ribonuclease HII [Bryobacteraceae bacterium]
MATKAKKPPKLACGGKHEKAARLSGYTCIAGVDEVGRGALFGPVFAAAVILSPDRPIRGLKDSKQLDREQRELLTGRIRERAVAHAIGAADAYEIDRINIYQASKLAMRRAIEKLAPACDYLLTDAMPLDLGVPCQAIIHGDAKVQCIAAASILAKTTRDQCMREWDAVFPQFGLARHKGYSTDEHMDALRKYGPTLMHRFSFEPVRTACSFPLWTGYDEKEEEDLAVQHATA